MSLSTLHFPSQYPHTRYVRASYQKIFQNNPQMLAEMLALRLGGQSYRYLVAQYHIDRTSIRHWCVKFQVQPILPEVRLVHNFNPQPKVSVPQKVQVDTSKYASILEEENTRNQGKSYKEYLMESQQRHAQFS